MHKQEKLLIWLPVILLPAGNLLSLFFTPVSFDSRILLFSLVGAMAEELFFRWFLLETIFLPRILPRRAIILTAILFAIMHLLNLRNGTFFPDILLEMFCAFCFSLWAGAVVWRRGNIFIPLLAHVLLNLTAWDNTQWILSLSVCIAVLVDGLILISTAKPAVFTISIKHQSKEC